MNVTQWRNEPGNILLHYSISRILFIFYEAYPRVSYALRIKCPLRSRTSLFHLSFFNSEIPKICSSCFCCPSTTNYIWVLRMSPVVMYVPVSVTVKDYGDICTRGIIKFCKLETRCNLIFDWMQRGIVLRYYRRPDWKIICRGNIERPIFRWLFNNLYANCGGGGGGRRIGYCEHAYKY